MRLLLALLILFVGLGCTFALTKGELAALESFHQSWTNLSLQQPPWTSNYSTACDNPPWFGLTCANIGDEMHITELYVVLARIPFPTENCPFTASCDAKTLLTWSHPLLFLLYNFKGLLRR